MMSSAMDDRTKRERLNLRVSSDALATIRDAAAVQNQDMTSFVLGAALERARGILAEDRLLRLTPHDVLQLERELDREPRVSPQLAALFKKFGEEGVQHEVPNREPASTGEGRQSTS